MPLVNPFSLREVITRLNGELRAHEQAQLEQVETREMVDGLESELRTLKAELLKANLREEADWTESLRMKGQLESAAQDMATVSGRHDRIDAEYQVMERQFREANADLHQRKIDLEMAN